MLLLKKNKIVLHKGVYAAVVGIRIYKSRISISKIIADARNE
jgi:hypothetical protein